jgi:UDP-N-acetylglucosamine 2-epimerase (non-hydrolysing)/GDP/UDP-N,N'-diacetylbacillosamine 2-epimerase (hydrolysing)
MRRRRIGVVTGTRAEYGYLRPLMRSLLRHDRLELRIYASGMHLLKEYGDSIKEIESDGFKVSEVVDMGSKAMMNECDLARSIGRGVEGFSEVYMRDKPDIVVVFGDRIEPFAAAIAATTMNIPVAHIAGGGTGFGDIDHILRHTITKLSHLHFTQTEQSRQRVLNLGEEDWRVHNTGSLTLDTILSTELPSRADFSNRLGMSDKPWILVVHHPTTTEWQQAREQMTIILKSVAEVSQNGKTQIAVIYPNDYPGGADMVDVIESFANDDVGIHIFRNLSHLDFITLLGLSSVFVGNSSSGIAEAPSLGIPYVCVGTRQKDRERARNVIEVSYNEEAIIAAIKKALHDKTFLDIVAERNSPYGDGTAAEQIVDVLSTVDLDKKLIQKKMTY